MNVIRSGVILMVYEAAVLITFLVISSPIATTISAIATAGTTTGVPQMTYYKNLINQVMGICFVIAMITPIVWFLVETMRREQDWGYQ